MAIWLDFSVPQAQLYINNIISTNFPKNSNNIHKNILCFAAYNLH